MKFRVARHTDNLKEIIHFYNKFLGFAILGSFENHDNYNGVFLGLKNENWELEFTSSNEKPNHKTDEDDLIVFYTDTEDQFDEIISALRKENINPIKAKNSYWNRNGITVLDPDNFRVVIAKPRK
jgi:catechol 2,3-dioxygenase-like lactoylglutathione lyase family enzyme